MFILSLFLFWNILSKGIFTNKVCAYPRDLLYIFFCIGKLPFYQTHPYLELLNNKMREEEKLYMTGTPASCSGLNQAQIDMAALSQRSTGVVKPFVGTM